MDDTQTHKQTGIRLPENLIQALKKKAKNQGLSFNRYVESVLMKDAEIEIPHIDPEEEISSELLSLSGTIPMPTKEEIATDPRIADALGL